MQKTKFSWSIVEQVNGAAGAGRGSPFSQISGTIPHSCCSVSRIGSFGALPQNWKIHVRVKLLGSAPTDAPEACAGHNFTLLCVDVQLFIFLSRPLAEGN